MNVIYRVCSSWNVLFLFRPSSPVSHLSHLFVLIAKKKMKWRVSGLYLSGSFPLEFYLEKIQWSGEKQRAPPPPPLRTWNLFDLFVSLHGDFLPCDLHVRYRWWKTNKKNSVKSDQCVSKFCFFFIAHSCCMYVNGTPNIMPPLSISIYYIIHLFYYYTYYINIYIFSFFRGWYTKKGKKWTKKNHSSNV